MDLHSGAAATGWNWTAIAAVGGIGGAIIVAAITAAILAWQVRRTLEWEGLRYLDEKWDRLRETRRAAAQAIIDDCPSNQAVDEMLDFYELVAEFVDDKTIQLAKASDAFFWYLWNFRAAADEYVEWVRTKEGEESWSSIDGVRDRMASRFEEPQVPDSEAVKEFLRDETGASRDQAQFREWRGSHREPGPSNA
jgi:hypothetical protein